MKHSIPTAGVLAIVALLVPTVGVCATTAKQQNDMDTARITSVIEAVGLFADFGQFEAMCQLFDTTSTADYRSLWNNEPFTGTPSEMATGWSGFIPGFDRTRHAIDVAAVKVTGDAAAATASIVARHWLDGEQWHISGTYDIELRRRNDGWKISAWTFTLADEVGDRALVDAAEAKAATLIERPIICPAGE